MSNRPGAIPGIPPHWFSRFRQPALYALCYLSLLLIFLFDLFIPPGVAIGVLYTAVILASLWLPQRNVTLSCAMISFILIIAPLFYETPDVQMWKVVFNRAISIFTVAIVTSLGLKRKEIEQQRNTMLHQCELALQEVKTLRGLLPICASCKKIKNNNGEWTEVESYIKKHSGAEFTHSICPHCAERLYPDFYNKKGSTGD